MKELRIGIIGLGGVANAHLNAYRTSNDVNIISVCDLQSVRANEVAERHKARAYGDYRKLLADGGIDLVLVLTPASTHRDIVLEAAKSRIHILCEKPLAVVMSDAETMVNECRKFGVKLFYGSCYRYLPAVEKAHELIQAGAIGKVQLMTEQVIGGCGLDGYHGLPSDHYPLGGPGGSGMGLMDHGIHLVDIFSWFTKSEIVYVEGKGQISGEPGESEYLAMRFESGAVGHLIYNSSTYSTCLPNEGMFSEGQGWSGNGAVSGANRWESAPGSICVYGTTGSLRIFHYVNALYISNREGIRRISLTGRPALDHFATQLEDCARVIREDKEPAVTGHDGLRALGCVLSVYRNDRQAPNDYDHTKNLHIL